MQCACSWVKPSQRHIDSIGAVLLVQFCANDSTRAEVLASFRGALEPLRALLKVRLFPSFSKHPEIVLGCLGMLTCRISV